MILIDTLIHRYHGELSGQPTRPVGCNLIAGRMADIVAFLDRLSYEPRSTPETRSTRLAWRAKLEQARRIWGVPAGGER
jgi:hypothetical protein